MAKLYQLAHDTVAYPEHAGHWLVVSDDLEQELSGPVATEQEARLILEGLDRATEPHYQIDSHYLKNSHYGKESENIMTDTRATSEYLNRPTMSLAERLADDDRLAAEARTARLAKQGYFTIRDRLAASRKAHGEAIARRRAANTPW